MLALLDNCRPCAEFLSGMLAAGALLSVVMVLWHLMCLLQPSEEE